ALLDEMAPVADPKDADTAIFYSISNTQKGLRGVSFGEHLIKGVVAKLSEEMPGLKTFATLSPLPRFRDWLDKQDADVIASAFGEAEQGGLRALGGSDALDEALRAVLANPDWHQDPVTLKAIKEPILRLGTRYLLSKDKRGRPVDPVAHFHLKNGARLEHLNWLADTSENGLRQSAGLMVNYFYLQSDIEKNHEAYLRDGTVVLGAEVKALRRGLKNFSESPLKRLGIG
ncbi:MAG: malonyl-CoA decarboxylase family protein, partial [Pseudomonadota bacterium]